ncbi:nitrate- and nitrite sensing domain-containing protein [Streptomyces violaceorubidus]
MPVSDGTGSFSLPGADAEANSNVLHGRAEKGTQEHGDPLVASAEPAVRRAESEAVAQPRAGSGTKPATEPEKGSEAGPGLTAEPGSGLGEGSRSDSGRGSEGLAGPGVLGSGSDSGRGSEVGSGSEGLAGPGVLGSGSDSGRGSEAGPGPEGLAGPGAVGSGSEAASGSDGLVGSEAASGSDGLVESDPGSHPGWARGDASAGLDAGSGAETVAEPDAGPAAEAGSASAPSGGVERPEQAAVPTSTTPLAPEPVADPAPGAPQGTSRDADSDSVPERWSRPDADQLGNLHAPLDTLTDPLPGTSCTAAERRGGPRRTRPTPRRPYL